MKDLLKLYSIHSVSETPEEKEICDWICKRLDDFKVDYKRVDNTIYHIGKDNKALLSAHLDQVATKGKAVHFYKVANRYIYGYNSNFQRTSLGADDKNGVWLILKLLEKGKEFDFIISESEEVGCVGIKKIEQEIKNSKADYCIVLDRRDNNEILNKGSATNYCKCLADNLKNFLNRDYKVSSGTLSDTQTISKYIESVNMSAAYFNPHTAKEFTDFERLEIIKKDLEDILDYFVHYPAPVEDYKTASHYPSYYNKNKSYYDSDYWNNYGDIK